MVRKSMKLINPITPEAEEGMKLFTGQYITCTTANQRIQRGAKRPLGKSKKNRLIERLPSRLIPMLAAFPIDGSVCSTLLFITIENTTRVNEANSAIRFSDLRRKSTSATRL